MMVNPRIEIRQDRWKKWFGVYIQQDLELSKSKKFNSKTKCLNTLRRLANPIGVAVL